MLLALLLILLAASLFIVRQKITVSNSLLWDQNLSDQTVSFTVKIIVGQLDTFTESISHVSVLDGISIMLPDQQGQLQRPSIPQFIVSSLVRNGTVAILDFTCAEQWKWVTA